MTQEQVAQQAASAMQRGITAARAGLRTVAASAFERAAELTPESPEVWNWLAWTANSPNNTMQCLRRAIELSPDDAAAQAGLEWAARLNGETLEPVRSAKPTRAAETKLAERVHVSNVVSDSLPEASVSVSVMEKPDRADVFQTDAIGWNSLNEVAVPEVVELSKVADLPSVEPLTSQKLRTSDEATAAAFTMPQFPAIVIPPPEPELELTQKDNVNDLATKIAETVATQVAPPELPLTRHETLITREPIVSVPFQVAEPAARIERPVPPAFVPPVSRRETIDPYADDDPRRFSELVRQASQMPLPVRPAGSAPEAFVQSRFTDLTAKRPVETSRTGELWPALPDQAQPVFSNNPADDEPVDLDALTRAFRPALFDSTDDGRLVVMVVDDSPTVRKLVALTLERRGFRVIAAADGVHAIRELGSCRPDLILLDITMPRLDGYRLCKLIKKHEVTQHIPVVMLSGKDGLFDKLRGRLVGCSDYITKPFEADSLTQKVTKYLSASPAR